MVKTFTEDEKQDIVIILLSEYGKAGMEKILEEKGINLNNGLSDEDCVNILSNRPVASKYESYKITHMISTATAKPSHYSR